MSGRQNSRSGSAEERRLIRSELAEVDTREVSQQGDDRSEVNVYRHGMGHDDYINSASSELKNAFWSQPFYKFVYRSLTWSTNRNAKPYQATGSQKGRPTHASFDNRTNFW